jgi:hypothetical protein
LAVTSALASNRRNLWFHYDFLEFLDHADYESDISFLIRPSGGPVWFTGVPHCPCMSYHRTKGMILVDLDESYQNMPKSPHIARKKVPLLWAQKS